MMTNEMQTGLGEGPHILTVTCAGVLRSGSGRKAIHVLLEDEDGLELIKRFPLSKSSPVEDYLDFAQSCGLTESEAWNRDLTPLRGRKVEAEVFEDEDGRLDARGWARVPGGA